MNHHIDLDRRHNRNRIAKMTVISIGTAILGLALLMGGCSKKNASTKWSLKRSAASAQLKSFVAEKEAQADAAARAEGKKMLPEYKALFAAAAKGRLAGDPQHFSQPEPARAAIRAPRSERRAADGNAVGGGDGNLWRLRGLCRRRGQVLHRLWPGHHRLDTAGQHLLWRHRSGTISGHRPVQVPSECRSIFYAHAERAGGRGLSGLPPRHVRGQNLHSHRHRLATMFSGDYIGGCPAPQCRTQTQTGRELQNGQWQSIKSAARSPS